MKLSDIITPQISQPMPNQQTIHLSKQKDPKRISIQHKIKILKKDQASNYMSIRIRKSQSQDYSVKCQDCQVIRQQLLSTCQALGEMKSQLQKKQSEVHTLQQQISEIKLQDQYLLKVIEQLRDKKPIVQDKSQAPFDKMYRQKLQQLNFANKQIVKLKQWLKEEKVQVFRYIQCVHIKDQIIANLEKQLNKLRQAKPKKRAKKFENPTINTVSQQDQLTKFRRKAKQLQEQVYQLTQEIDIMRNDNSTLKQHLSRVTETILGNSTYKQLPSPILKLNQSMKICSSPEVIQKSIKQNEKQKQNSKNNINMNNSGNNNKIQKLLSNKCLHLQTQIQRLLLRVEDLKMENERLKGLHRKQYSFARLTNPAELQTQQVEQENIL